MSTKSWTIGNFCKYIILIFTISVFAVPEISGPIKIILIAALLINLYRNSFHLVKSFYLFWGIILSCYALLSVLYSDEISWSIMGFQALIKLLLLGVLLNEYFCKSSKEVSWGLFCLTVAGFCLILRLALEFFLSGGWISRLGFSTLNANDIALKLAFSILAYNEIRNNFSIKIWFWLEAFITSFAIILSSSRKAFFLLVFGWTITNVLKSTSKLRFLLNAVLVFSFAIVSFYSIMNFEFLYEIIGIRFEGIINAFLGSGHVDASTLERLALIDTGVDLWEKSPIWGYGINTFTVLSGFGIYAHNNYIEIAVGLGGLGVIVWYSIYLYLIRCSYLGDLKPFAFSFSILMPFLDFGLVSYMENYVHIIFAIIIASAIIKNRTCKFDR